ncbi:MAG: hypothetical protein WCI18_06020 [Pseudomonadota bacterium]
MEKDVSIQEMAQNVSRNLAKNGFPAKSVSFSLDALYDAAHEKGFHFNKVRDLLGQEGVQSEIVGSRMVFSATHALNQDLLKDPKFAQSLKDPNFLESAMSQLSGMDPEKLGSLASSIPGFNSEKMASMLNLLKTMSPEQRKAALESAKEFMSRK